MRFCYNAAVCMLEDTAFAFAGCQAGFFRSFLTQASEPVFEARHLSPIHSPMPPSFSPTHSQALVAPVLMGSQTFCSNHPDTPDQASLMAFFAAVNCSPSHAPAVCAALFTGCQTVHQTSLKQHPMSRLPSSWPRSIFRLPTGLPPGLLF